VNYGDYLYWNSYTQQWAAGYPSIAIGRFAGQTGQGNFAIAIGSSAGASGQKQYAIALGNQAGQTSQGEYSIAIGAQAGQGGQGANSIAIGNLAVAGLTALRPNTIVINASGAVMTPGTTGTYIRPLRSNNQEIVTNVLPLGYNTITGELIYSTNEAATWGTETGKPFVIDHPIDKDRYLVHTCLEGPEVGVYYRGKGEIVDTKFITIELPNYVDKLAYNFTVSVTGIFNEATQIISTYNASEVENGKFRVYGPSGKFHWLIYGERAPVEVEPLKSNVEVKGTGPYKWIQK
jgi:hypothetical protein